MKTHDALNRRSRLVRSPSTKRIQLTDRDIEIFRLLERYRYLRSTQVHALVGGKSQKRCVERLGALYHDGGYIGRPAQQWQAIDARYAPIVYELGEAGRDVLKGQGLIREILPSPSQGRTTPHRRFWHELMICDVLCSLEIGARAAPGLRLIWAPEILSKAPESTRNSPNPLAVSVPIKTVFRNKTFVCDQLLFPDALFGIEYEINGRRTYRFFALEADRATEPIARSSLEQSSYLRKLLQYREMAARVLYKAHWGIPNLIVLTVTTIDRHAAHMMDLVSELTGALGSTMFLFKVMPDADGSRSPSFMLSKPFDRIGHKPLNIGVV